MDVVGSVPVAISYEPLAHSQLTNDIIVMRHGGRVGLYNRPHVDPTILFETIQALGPTSMAGVPRIWNIIYSEYKKALHLEREKQTPKNSNSNSNSINTTNQESEVAETTTPTDNNNKEKEKEKEEVELEEKVMAKFRHLLGNRLGHITTGGAPTSLSVIQFLKRYDFYLR